MNILDMTHKVSAINKCIFNTYDDALAFANDLSDSAIGGLLLTVIADGENNGTYFVKKAKMTSNDNAELVKLTQKTEIDEELNKKQDKTIIQTTTTNDIYQVNVDNKYIIHLTNNTTIKLESYEDDGYAHSYEIVLDVDDTAYSVMFPSSVKWVKDLDIVPNARYYIIIEDNTAMWTSITN